MNMRIAIYIGAEHLRTDERLLRLVSDLERGGALVYFINSAEELLEGTDMLLSVGGDGTFLSAGLIALSASIPVAGVNMGRMGFLSEGRPEEIADAILSGDYTIETHSVLGADVKVEGWESETPLALNEMTVRRSGAAMLVVDVCVDGVKLPTYWADGLVISTSSGSTAYSLSAGGSVHR